MSVQGITGAAPAPEAQIEVPTTETITPVTAQEKEPEVPKDDRFAAKFAALGRRDKEIKAQMKAIAEKEAAIAKQTAELEERSKGDTTFKETFAKEFKSNPLKVMQDYGITYEELSEMVLNDQNPTTDMKMKRMAEELKSETQKEVEALRKQLAERDEAEKAREAQQAERQYQQVKDNFISKIKSEVESKADSYELVHFNGQAAIDLTFEVMQSYYDSTAEWDKSGTIIKPGKVLSVEDALKEVESYYEEQARPLTKLKKFQQTSPAPATSPTEGQKSAPTLTNSLSTEEPVNGRKKLSKEEAFQEALKVIRYTNE